MLLENDISPFEVTQSGLVPSLLTYLTKVDLDGSGSTGSGGGSVQEEVSREGRIRTFLHVFLGCPKSADSEDAPDPEHAAKFQMFVQKMNACVNHLEQFPINMHDMTSGSSGVRSAGSTLRFFKTQYIKCNLQRHPDCSSLKMWKGGLVKIDPLALVQAIERCESRIERWTFFRRGSDVCFLFIAGTSSAVATAAPTTRTLAEATTT